MGFWALLIVPICGGWFVLGMWAQHFREKRSEKRNRWSYHGPG